MILSINKREYGYLVEHAHHGWLILYPVKGMETKNKVINFWENLMDCSLKMWENFLDQLLLNWSIWCDPSSCWNCREGCRYWSLQLFRGNVITHLNCLEFVSQIPAAAPLVLSRGSLTCSAWSYLLHTVVKIAKGLLGSEGGVLFLL